MKHRLPLFLALCLSLNACGDDDGGATDSGTDTGAMDMRQADLALDAAEDASIDAADAETDTGVDAGPARTPALVVGNLGGTATIARRSLEDLSETTGSPATFGTYNDVAVGGGWIALPLPGSGEVALIDAETLEVAATAAVTPTPLTAAIDATRSILYVFAANGGDRQFHAFEIGDDALSPVEGSPFDTDLVATEFTVDEGTGRLVGVSSSTVWIAEPNGTPLFGTPESLSAGSIVIDAERGRVLFTSRFPSALHARALSDFSALEGSPVSLPGEFPTSLAVDGAGNTFVLDGASLGSSDPTTLVRVGAAPLALAPACGTTDGCDLANTETGLAINAGANRLYVTEVRGEESNGRLHVWDISDPAMPTDLETPVDAAPVPTWLSID